MDAAAFYEVFVSLPRLPTLVSVCYIHIHSCELVCFSISPSYRGSALQMLSDSAILCWFIMVGILIEVWCNQSWSVGYVVGAESRCLWLSLVYPHLHPYFCRAHLSSNLFFLYIFGTFSPLYLPLIACHCHDLDENRGASQQHKTHGLEIQIFQNVYCAPLERELLENNLDL